MNIAQELSIVRDNIAEYGITNITQLEYDAIYQQGRCDAIEEYRKALYIQFNQNKAVAMRCAKGNRLKEMALTHIDLEEVDNIAEQLKEQDNG